MPQPDSLREFALGVIERHLGKEYLWGGNDPVAGFDCSGLMIEGLKSAGVLPRAGDWNADALLNEVFARKPRITERDGMRRGMLVFWRRGQRIGHVEMVYAVYGDTVLTIGAAGGGSGTTSRAAAIEQDAYIKIRPLAPNYVAAVDPF